MAAEQRKLLEQLMGDSMRSMPGAQKAPQLDIDDPKICKSYLLGTCPHDLFVNTKQDLGVCPRVHNEALKTQWETMPAERREKLAPAFKREYCADMAKYVEGCNRRIEEANRKLEKTAEEIRQTNRLMREIGELSANITIGLEEVEALGDAGQVNLAVTEYFKAQQYQQQKAEKERELKGVNDTSGPSGHQKLQVCDMCGAYLSRLDNDRRLADHFNGKLHIGFTQMRKAYDALKEDIGWKPNERNVAMDFGSGPPPGMRGDGDSGYGRRDGFGGRDGYGGRDGGGYRGGRGGRRGHRGGW